MSTQQISELPSIESSLRSGRSVRLRPVRPDDKERLKDGFAHLSAESRYQRFHGTTQALTDSQLRYFTEVDQHDHVAWGAVDPTDPDEPGLGVIRFVRLRGESTVAEVAVTIADELQRQGLGTLLIVLAAGLAAPRGIHTLRFVVQSDNTAMLGLLRSLGGEIVEVEPPELTVDLVLPLAIEGRRDELSRVMRLAAR